METPAGAIYHVARDGQVIGAFPFPTLAAKFKEGTVKASDHYLVEGTSDWKLVSDLKSQFTAHERQLKAEAKAAKEAAELEDAKARALEIEAEQIRREQAAADRKKPKPWKCHTCNSIFESNGHAKDYPFASGGWLAFGLAALSGIFAVGAFKEPIAIFFAAILALFAFGFIISFGVERGLQQFNSYRPRCPNCSSPYCSKQPD